MEGEIDSFSGIRAQKHSKQSKTGMYFRRPHLSEYCSFLVGPNTFYLSFEFHELGLIDITPQLLVVSSDELFPL